MITETIKHAYGLVYPHNKAVAPLLPRTARKAFCKRMNIPFKSVSSYDGASDYRWRSCEAVN